MTGISERSSTVAEALRGAARALADAGIGESQGEARRLLAAALGWSMATLLSRSDECLGPTDAARIESFLARRCRHEPLSRILGEREFYGRTFRLGPATLDPRPDSETLIDATLALLREEERGKPLRVLDIGTGTGCLLLTLLLELPEATGIGTDASADAIDVARDNAQRLGASPRAKFVKTDLAAGLPGPFDVIVSNPPYVRSADIAQLDENVRTFDPHLALDGGPDGLDYYRRIVRDLCRLMPDGGLVVFEVGHDQAADVAAELEAAPGIELVSAPQLFTDVAGIHRVVASRTRSAGLTQKPLGFRAPAR